jgi:hypothetical protein
MANGFKDEKSAFSESPTPFSFYLFECSLSLSSHPNNP